MSQDHAYETISNIEIAQIKSLDFLVTEVCSLGLNG